MTQGAASSTQKTEPDYCPVCGAPWKQLCEGEEALAFLLLLDLMDEDLDILF